MEENDRIRSLAVTDFRERSQQHGFSFHAAYLDLLDAVIEHFGVPNGGDGQVRTLEQLLRENGVRRILEVGCGKCQFLAAFADVAASAGCTLVGIDRKPSPDAAAQQALKDRGVRVIAGDATYGHAYGGERDFDLVLSCGVMSLWGAYPLDRYPSLHFGELHPLAVQTAVRTATEMAEQAVGVLSPHPLAAVFANTFRNILMIDRARISRAAQILHWRVEGKGRNEYRWERPSHFSEAPPEKWIAFWDQQPILAILARKPGAAS
jgi:SAM-dependent methyltransferase